MLIKSGIPYSLGDAIDWKRGWLVGGRFVDLCPLLARGRDRLETLEQLGTYLKERLNESPTR